MSIDRAAVLSGPSPIRQRRTKRAIEQLKAVLYEVLAADHPMTVRQVFYQLVARGAIEKTEAEYKRTVCRLLAVMRRAEELPYTWLEDNTRWVRRPESYASVDDYLDLVQRPYRRALWDDQPDYVELWCEKDALAGVVYEATAPWDVPLKVARGYASLTYLYEAAQTMPPDKACYLYYLGDHDPSGRDAERYVREQLEHFGVVATFERLAVTAEQIIAYELPTRPTKRSDRRGGDFRGRSVELDALPPDVLREVVARAIERHLDPDVLRRTREIEAAERDTLFEFIARFGRSAP